LPISPYGITDFASAYLKQTKQPVVFTQPFAVEMPDEGVGEEPDVLPEDLPPLGPGPEVGDTLPNLFVCFQQLVPLKGYSINL
jgi:hypothetical protein